MTPTYLFFSGLGLHEFPGNILDPFNKIYFADNFLTDNLKPDTFILVRGALELDLTNNSITRLSSGVFKIMTDLRILTLRNNLIYEIKNDTFDGLSLLTHL